MSESDDDEVIPWTALASSQSKIRKIPLIFAAENDFENQGFHFFEAKSKIGR